MRIEADKIASVTRRLGLGQALTLSETIEAEAGAVVAARILNDKHSYNQLEDVFGRMNALGAGDVIVGALGHRNALHGYEGLLPKAVKPGDRLNLLNLGGVIGECVSHNPEVGPPFEVEVLGQVLRFPVFGSRAGTPANIAQGAIESSKRLPDCPVIYVAGTCMNSGKTMAASTIVKHLRRAGYRVAGAKLTGVSLLRDVLTMRDQGAQWVADFTDAGAVCTDGGNAAALAHRIFSALALEQPDVIVAETGDGVMGEYGVQAILADEALRELAGAFVFCANDPVGAAGGLRYLKETFGIEANVVTGPATDNRVGVRFVEQVLGVPAANARAQPDALLRQVRGALGWRGAA